MLDTCHNRGGNKPYVIGTHRKIMLVDNELLLTGGRNLEDEYSRFEGNTHFTFHDLDIVLAGNFSESTGALFKDLWEQSRNMASLLQGQPPPSDFGLAENGGIASFTNDELMEGEEETNRRQFYRSSSLKSSEHVGRDVSLFQLDHKAGRPDGHDVILSTLFFLLETAQTSIDLFFGYFFDLFPCLEETLVRALDRGVKVRLITNSRETNDMPFLNELFRKAFVRLMEIGVEMYMPSGNKNNYSIHYKAAMIDSRVLLAGSWNSFGTSVFYESEFSVVIFKEDEGAFGNFDSFFEESFRERRLVLMKTAPDPWKLPMIAYLATSKFVHRQVDRGY
jgi:putative cardiolipin synthase